MDEPLRTDADLAALLEATERRRLRALVEADLRTADALHVDDYELIKPGGLVLSKAAYLRGIADGTLRYRRFEPAGQIRMRIWDGAAALRYPVEIEVVHDGMAYRDDAWHTDLYELREDRWLAVWSHATRIRSREP